MPESQDSALAQPTKRTSHSKRARFAIFERDAFTCQYCGARPPDVVLQLDHIHPISKGGDDTEENLTTSCRECNAGKTNRILGAVIPRPDADLQFMRTQQEIAEARAYMQARQHRDELYKEIAAHLMDVWDECLPGYFKVPTWVQLTEWIERFGIEEVEHAIRYTGRRHRASHLSGSAAALKYINTVLKNRKEEAQ